MRPAGEVAQAIINTIKQWQWPEIPEDGEVRVKGLSLSQLAEASGVGKDAARTTVANLKRTGRLRIVGQCRIERRNRPAALYDLNPESESRAGHGWVPLERCVSGWAR